MKQHRQHTSATSRTLLGSLMLTLFLHGCGGGSSGNNASGEHENTKVNTAGRLALIEANTPNLYIHGLDDHTLEAQHTLEAPASAVYTSPRNRYAVVMQRNQDQVQFVDGGIWQEDHGDHPHDYKEKSKPLKFKVQGPRPTHYDVQSQQQAAIFMDGNRTSTPVQNASTHLITEASIGSGKTVAKLEFNAPLHGLSEPVGDKLLTSVRASDAVDTLPTHLHLYVRNGADYNFVRPLSTRCDSMHGSFSSGNSTVVGCGNGRVMLVKHTSSNSVDDGQLIHATQGENLVKEFVLGSIVGHARLPDQFIAMGTYQPSDTASQTTQLYAINGQNASAQRLIPTGWGTDRRARAYGFERTGQRFFILDQDGNLYIMQNQNQQWSHLKTIEGVIRPIVPTLAATPAPAVVSNHARDELYITDPIAQELVVINSNDGTVLKRQSLKFTPAGAAWLGIAQ